MPNDNEAASTSKPDRSPEHTAGRYVERLQGQNSPVDAAKRQRYVKSRAGDGDVVIGVRMKHVFELSKEFKEMPLGEIELLLESRIHEVRAGGVKIMAYQAASKTTPEGRRGEVFELYLRRHDRINDWDLVDLGAWDVVGRYLVDKPRRSFTNWRLDECLGATDHDPGHPVLRPPRRPGRHVPDRRRAGERRPRPGRRAVGGSLREAASMIADGCWVTWTVWKRNNDRTPQRWTTANPVYDLKLWIGSGDGARRTFPDDKSWKRRRGKRRRGRNAAC